LILIFDGLLPPPLAFAADSLLLLPPRLALPAEAFVFDFAAAAFAIRRHAASGHMLLCLIRHACFSRHADARCSLSPLFSSAACHFARRRFIADYAIPILLPLMIISPVTPTFH
jgi:hypothetical protein